MNEANAFSAAKSLWGHWQNGSTLQKLPEHTCPKTRAEGYAVQGLLPTVSGRIVAGWKIAATSLVGQKHINISGPLAGRILSGQVFSPGSTVPSSGNRMRVAEPEMAFTLSKDLPPRTTPYTVDDVLEAVASLHPALEFPNSRFEIFTEAGEAQLLADCACAHQFMLGPAAPESWRKLDLSKQHVHAKVTKRDHSLWTREGTGEAVLGDPRIALAWIINELTSQSITLKAGQFFTTGTCMVPLEIEPGDEVLADFGVLGQISMKFGD